MLSAALTGCGGSPSSRPTSTNVPESRETWDAIYLQDSYVGYFHAKERTDASHSPPLIESEAEMRMSMKRDGQHIALASKRTSAETVDGVLVSFREEQQLGPTPVVSTGQVKDGKLVIESRDAERTTTRTIDLPEKTGGPFAPERSLTRQPMQPGETRTVRFYEPMLGALAAERLEAADLEQVELLDGSQKLLRIESTLTIEGQPQPIRGVRWTNDQGETLKTESTAMRQVTYRTSKEQALRASTEEPAFDLMRGTIVKLDRPLEDARQTHVARYRVELDSGDPSTIFAAGPTQHVKSTGPHTAEVTITSLDPEAPMCEGASGAATDADRQPSGMIQSDDPRIVEMAREAAGDRTTPGEIAIALEEFVSNKMRAKRSYSTAFASAADVARTLEGDCTEHAVLLAALARAAGIPARVAIGLVYSPADEGFAYHMWTEMLLSGCWVPLDATLGEGRISADHLKLTDSNLTDRDGFASFLPLAEVLGQLKIEVLEAR